jgi:hypothetical protein
MTMSTKFLVATLLLLVSLSSSHCLAKEVEGREFGRIDGVIKVFMHLPGDYSVMTLEGDEYKVYRISSWIVGFSEVKTAQYGGVSFPIKTGLGCTSSSRLTENHM